MRPHLACLVVALLGILAGAIPVAAQAPGVTIEPWLDGLDQPTYVTSGGDARLFIVEQAGRVQVIPDAAAADPAPQPLLDITDRVGSEGSEQGLLSIAFAPDSHMGRYVYASYTDLDGNSVISRFDVAEDGLAADPASERIVLTQEQPYRNHNGGLIVFGPDEMLYIGFGDGGSQGDPDGNGQRLDTWLGKILRVDVNPERIGEAGYVVPEDNPFVGDPDAQPEIWLYGLRNPWRFAFDPAGTMIAVADVGGSKIEEVTILPLDEAAGANLGWNQFEGTNCHSDPCDPEGKVMPSLEYTHAQGCSITGGYFVAEDAYIYADYCSGLVWLARQGDDGTWTASNPIETGMSISSFGLGGDGTLYLCDLGGSVYRVIASV